jgi:tryptophanase
MDRDPDTLGEIPVKLGLIGLAVPRKTYLQSHLDYLADRLTRLFENKELIKGLNGFTNHQY